MISIWIGFLLIIFGLGKMISPKYFKHYRTDEVFGEVDEPSKFSSIFERLFGFGLFAGGVVSVIFYVLK